MNDLNPSTKQTEGVDKGRNAKNIVSLVSDSRITWAIRLSDSFEIAGHNGIISIVL